MKNINLQIQKAQQIASDVNTKKLICKHTGQTTKNQGWKENL